MLIFGLVSSNCATQNDLMEKAREVLHGTQNNLEWQVRVLCFTIASAVGKIQK